MKVRSIIGGLVVGLAIDGVSGLTQASAGARSVRLAGIEDDSASHIAAGLVQRAYQRIGIDAESDFLPAERAVSVVNAGLYDGDVFHVAGMEHRYPNLVRVPVTIMRFEIVAFTLQPHLHVSSWADLQGHRICIRRGIKLIEQHTAQLPEVYRVNRYSNILEMLKMGRCELAVLPRSARLDIAQAGLLQIHEAGPVLETVNLYHHVYKSHAADVPALTKALRELRQRQRE